jgi:hypothetical protein
MTPTIWPGWISIETSSTAVVFPNERVTFRILIIATHPFGRHGALCGMRGV